MKLKSISGFCILLVFAAIISAGSANARLLTTLSGAQAHITENVYEAKVTDLLYCDGNIMSFYYEQRMIINGKVEMVLTEFIYPAGTFDLVLVGQCDGKNLYESGRCSCITTDFTKTVSLKDIEPAATVDMKADSQENFLTGHIPLLVLHNPTDFLWIRKDDKKNSFLL